MNNINIEYSLMNETIAITPERMKHEVSYEKAVGLSLEAIKLKIEKKIELELKDKLIDRYIELIFKGNTFYKFREYTKMRIEEDKFLNTYFSIDIRYELINVNRQYFCTMKKASENEIEMNYNSFDELIQNEEYMFIKGTKSKNDNLCLDEINKDVFYSVSRKYNNHFINLSYPKITTKSKYEPSCNGKLLQDLEKKKFDYYSILKYPLKLIEMEEYVNDRI